MYMLLFFSDSGNGQSRDDIKLRGFLYVGGVERSLHKSLLSSGLQLQSYRGCLKDIRINYRCSLCCVFNLFVTVLSGN